MAPCNDYLEKNLVGRLKQLLATLCLGPVTLGVSISWTSPVLPQLESNATSFHLTSEESSWVGSMLGLGVLAAALPIGYLSSRFGLKKCVIGLILPLLIFTVVAVFSKDVYSLCIARFFSGIATGGICVISPMYTSEISDVSFRGTLGSFFEFLLYVGVVLVAIIGAYVEYKTLTVMLGIVGLALTMIFIFLPESPTHLMKINKREEAERALRFYRSKNCDISDAMMEIETSIKSKENQLSVKEALTSRRVIRGLIAAVGLTVFQKFCGVDCILFYSVSIFQVTQTGMNAYTSTIVLALVQLVSAVLNVFVIEMANRRLFLFISTIGMGISLGVLGMYFQLKELGINFTGIEAIPLGSLIAYAFTFSMGMGPILWMINGELFAPDVKGLANGITMTSNWILLSTVTKSFPIMMNNMGPNYTFYLFAASMFLCAIFVKFFVPETRGKTLEQIQSDLSS
ncbi:facilitated trehalose transporter Tret1-2 homolog isoform X2 [Photinus pyralis]|uniref:facilitated trehalose transporter Tret1-2 homolog isoform X2 n=1 Tax=Photinus pyralis TaxID=7054 RepID=UPI00126734A4|nr:facilitated trehalose transporter Tret1-2 homolog isoform X2 [Photinus pyralis]